MIKKIISKLVNSQGEAIIPMDKFVPIHETQPQDVFIAGYPKSGNTWMQNLVAGLLFGIDTAYLPDRLTQELVPDVHAKKFYKRLLDITCFKTHHLPKPEYKRVIHLVRDGRDAMVSYYHMNRAQGKEITLEEMVVDAKGIIPSKWHTHCQEWNANPFQADIIRVRYEDLIAQPLHEMKKVCSFIGVERSTELLERVINGNSFEKMRKKEKQFGWSNDQWDPKNEFIRKGKIGRYKEEMTDNLISLFEKESSKMLKFYGYEPFNID